MVDIGSPSGVSTAPKAMAKQAQTNYFKSGPFLLIGRAAAISDNITELTITEITLEIIPNNTISVKTKNLTDNFFTTALTAR